MCCPPRCVRSFVVVILLTSFASVSFARSPEAMAKLLGRFDAAVKQDAASSEVATLQQQIDAEAGQKEAWKSRLFWYTDWSEALAKARTSGKPILSLRLLGRLDEELSCANSRFFRKTLYADPAVSQLLRDRFVLHWESVRPVPIITIDYGDGRTVKRTITGNSLHYVHLPNGVLVDALPGLMDRDTFRSELTFAANFAAGDTSEPALKAYWQSTSSRIQRTRAPDAAPANRPAEAAALRTFSKTAAEFPSLRAMRNPAGNIAKDTHLNQTQLRPVILADIARGGGSDVVALTKRIYRDVFLTPLDDPNMGLDVPDETALAR